MAGPRTIPIAELEEGSTCWIRGRVHRAAQVISGPGGVQCVFYDRGRAADGATPEAMAFWVEDATGRVLIPEGYEVRGGTLRHADHLDVIDGDIKQVSARLSDLKALRREAQRQKRKAPELLKEQRALKELATVLCCIRAHAHGNVHGGGRTLGHQATFIATESERLTADGHALRSIELALEVRQVVVAVDDEVLVEATFRDAPMPPGLGSGGGYRDRPTCLQASPPGPKQPIRVSPTEDSHAAEVTEERRHEENRRRAVQEPLAPAAPVRKTKPFEVIGSVVLVVLVALYIWMIR